VRKSQREVEKSEKERRWEGELNLYFILHQAMRKNSMPLKGVRGIKTDIYLEREGDIK
jgi:hypothetical protein